MRFLESYSHEWNHVRLLTYSGHIIQATIISTQSLTHKTNYFNVIKMAMNMIEMMSNYTGLQNLIEVKKQK